MSSFESRARHYADAYARRIPSSPRARDALANTIEIAMNEAYGIARAPDARDAAISEAREIMIWMSGGIGIDTPLENPMLIRFRSWLAKNGGK